MLARDGWGAYPRLSRRGLTAKDPICLDATAYSLPSATSDATEYPGRIAGAIAIGVRMYLRPGQVMHVFCSSKVVGNVAHVAGALETLGTSTRARVRVIVHDGIYNNSGQTGRSDSPETIQLACESAWLAHQTPGLRGTALGYAFSRASSDARILAAQLRAVREAHAQGHIQYVCLGIACPRNFAAALASLRAHDVPVRSAIVHPASYPTLAAHDLTCDAIATLPKLTYDQDLALSIGAAHVSSSRHGAVHSRHWDSALFAQPYALDAQ